MGTFTYLDSPSYTEKDAVRFLVGDTNGDQPLLYDEEIEWLIATWQDKNNVYYYAAVAAEAIASKLAREVSISADGQSLSLSELQEKYLKLATQLRAQYKELLASGVEIHVGGMNTGEQPDPTIKPFSFGTGMHDFGFQDYGSTSSEYFNELLW